MDGAHDNRGLGHDFLRHIERTRALVYVIDAAGVDGRDPVEDLRQLRTELELYSPGLSSRPSIVVANKTDLPAAAEHVPRLREEVGGLAGDGVVGMLESSFATGAGVGAVVMALRGRLSKIAM